MQTTQINGHHFVGTVKTNFSYTLKQPIDIRVTKSDGVFTAKAGNDTYFVIGSGDSKEDAINDFYLEFHLIVVDLKTFDKSISGFKKAFDFISKTSPLNTISFRVSPVIKFNIDILRFSCCC